MPPHSATLTNAGAVQAGRAETCLGVSRALGRRLGMPDACSRRRKKSRPPIVRRQYRRIGRHIAAGSGPEWLLAEPRRTWDSLASMLITLVEAQEWIGSIDISQQEIGNRRRREATSKSICRVLAAPECENAEPAVPATLLARKFHVTKAPALAWGPSLALSPSLCRAYITYVLYVYTNVLRTYVHTYCRMSMPARQLTGRLTLSASSIPIQSRGAFT